MRWRFAGIHQSRREQRDSVRREQRDCVQRSGATTATLPGASRTTLSLLDDPFVTTA